MKIACNIQSEYNICHIQSDMFVNITIFEFILTSLIIVTETM